MLAASLNSAVGRAGLMLMLGASVFGALAVLYGIRKGDTKLLRQSPRYAWLAMVGITPSVVMMPPALITRAFPMASHPHVGPADTPVRSTLASSCLHLIST